MYWPGCLKSAQGQGASAYVEGWIERSVYQDQSVTVFINNQIAIQRKGDLCYDLTDPSLTLDCGNHWPGGPVNQKIHWPPKKPTGPPKTCNDPNVFAAGIYDFTCEVAHFCTLGLYITKNKYELTLPSEFCRFPVKILAAYEALIFFFFLNHWPLGPVENKLWWPELARQPQKGMRNSGHIANVKACTYSHEYLL